jgi:hypothetical protein
MANYVIKDTTLQGIANAIRAKTGETGSIPTLGMADKISSISTGENLDAEVSTQETTIESIKTLLAEKANP